jgi:hypothetical protein
MFRFYIDISRFRQLFIVPGWMLNRSRILSELRCSSDGILGFKALRIPGGSPGPSIQLGGNWKAGENGWPLWIVGAILMRKGRGSEKSEGALVDG